MAEEAHQCHFCGTWVRNGVSTEDGTRHWLSDCRPDLVQHEPGEFCTWWNLETVPANRNCYAYSESRHNPSEPGGAAGIVWTDEHTHFHKDGPM